MGTNSNATPPPTLQSLDLTLRVRTTAGDVTVALSRDGKCAANWVDVLMACQAGYMLAMQRVGEGEFDGGE